MFHGITGFDLNWTDFSAFSDEEVHFISVIVILSVVEGMEKEFMSVGSEHLSNDVLCHHPFVQVEFVVQEGQEKVVIGHCSVHHGQCQ